MLLPLAGQTIAEDLVDLGPDDLLFVIGLRRRITLLRDVMALAKKLGIARALIADPSATELHELADWSLSCQIQSTSVFDSYTSVNSVITLLINLAMHENMACSHARLRKIEALHEDMGELKVGGIHNRHPGELLERLGEQYD
jgi:DNA-binding MurR/RpiR family transcriptional regulator